MTNSVVPVKVRLNGGLGNQMFQYFSGLALAEGDPNKLVLDFSRTSFIHDRVGLRAFAHGAHEFRCFLPTGGRIGAIDARWVELRNKVNIRLRSNQRRVIVESFAVLPSFSLDGDKTFELDGDFISSAILEKARNLGVNLNLKLRRPSQWFKHLADEACRSLPIMLHVRRGDYYQASSQWGLLSDLYYSRALDSLNLSRGDAVWIFSDDPDASARLISLPKSVEKFIVRPPRDSSAAESLILMTLGRGLIMGNSTLSWWAGQMTHVPTVVPVPFYRQTSHQWSLSGRFGATIRPNWVQAKADWLPSSPRSQ